MDTDQMKHEDIEREAKRLFRVVNGDGDGGSEAEFYAQGAGRPGGGWMRLAQETLCEKIVAAVFTPLPRSRGEQSQFALLILDNLQVKRFEHADDQKLAMRSLDDQHRQYVVLKYHSGANTYVAQRVYG